MDKAKRFFVQFQRSPSFTGFILLIAAIIVNVIIQGPANFFNPGSINTLMMSNLPFLLVCIAQAVLLISGTLDIAIGIQLAMVNVIVIMMPQELGVSIPLAWLAGIIASILISLVSAVGYSILRLPSLLVSFAMTYVIKGINVLIMPLPQGSVPAAYYKRYDSLIGGFIPVSVVILVAVYLIAWITMQSRFGKHVYAVGASPRNAFAAGINPVNVQMKAAALKGVIVGIAGISLTLMTASGNPLQAEAYGLRSISAGILGGLGFGGWGALSSGLFGGGFFVIVSNTVYYLFTLLYRVIPGFTVTSYWQNLISDIILLLGLFMTVLTAQQRRRTLRTGLEAQVKRGEKHGDE